jgi:hypothetical protein
MKLSLVWILLPIAASLAAAQEPTKPNLTPTIITATRQVSLFTGLEKQMLQAVQKKDKPSLEALISDDFEIGMPNADPLAGVDWEDSVLSKDFTLKSYGIRQMSVADLGDAAVVKYMRAQQASYKARDASGDFFVVDLWKKSGDSWKLANRYVARIGAAPALKTAPKTTGKQ